MFGMGFTEILLIAVLALLFIGPDKLPETMKNLARTLGKIKRAFDDTKSTIEQELRVDDLKQEVLSYKKEFNKAKNDLNSFKNIAQKEVNEIKQSAHISDIYRPSSINDQDLFNDFFDNDDDFEEEETTKPKKEQKKETKAITTAYQTPKYENVKKEEQEEQKEKSELVNLDSIKLKGE